MASASFTGVPVSVTASALAKYVVISGGMLVNPVTNWTLAGLAGGTGATLAAVTAAVDELRLPQWIVGGAPVPAFVVRSAADARAPVTTVISSATGNGVSPIVVTTAVAHGLVTNASVTIAGVTGNTAANGSGLVITVLTSITFSVNGSTGNGAYVSGGTVTAAGQPSVSAGDGTRVALSITPALVSAINADTTVLVALYAGLGPSLLRAGVGLPAPVQHRTKLRVYLAVGARAVRGRGARGLRAAKGPVVVDPAARVRAVCTVGEGAPKTGIAFPLIRLTRTQRGAVSSRRLGRAHLLHRRVTRCRDPGAAHLGALALAEIEPAPVRLARGRHATPAHRLLSRLAQLRPATSRPRPAASNPAATRATRRARARRRGSATRP